VQLTEALASLDTAALGCMAESVEDAALLLQQVRAYCLRARVPHRAQSAWLRCRPFPVAATFAAIKTLS
jgi:hypothetical protein